MPYNAVEKALYIYTKLLASNKSVGLIELAEMLGTSKQSIKRAIDNLEKSNFGKIDILEKNGRHYYALKKPDRQPKINLDVEGLRQLAMCRDLLLGILPASMRKNIDTTLNQSEAYLPAGETSGNDVRLASTLTKGAIDYSGCEKQLNAIMDAIRRQRVCQVSYKAGLNKPAREYCFAPKRLVSYHDAFFVHGWVVNDKGTPLPKHDNVTVLSLQRIQKVIIERRSSEKLPDVEISDNSFGILAGEEITVTILFAPEVATYVSERRWSSKQKTELHEDGSLTLVMRSTSPQEVVAWVLGFGPLAKVIEPKSIAEKVAEQARKIAGLYAGDPAITG